MKTTVQEKASSLKWVSSAALGLLILYLIVLVPYWIQFLNNGLSDDPSHFGVLGDYLGGVINPLLTFITFVFLIIQWRESQKRELKSMKLQHDMMQLEQQKNDRDKLNIQSTQFWQELQFTLTRIDKIKFENEMGIPALINFLSKYEKGMTIPAKFEMPCQSACDSIQILFNRIFSVAFLATESNEKREFINNQYDFLKVSITELDLITIYTVITKFNRPRDSYKFIQRLTNETSKLNHQFPSLNETVIIKKIMGFES